MMMSLDLLNLRIPGNLKWYSEAKTFLVKRLFDAVVYV